MTPAPEQRRGAGGDRHTHTAFGLALELDPEISAPGLTPAAPQGTNAMPPTRVLLDSTELRRRWAAIASEPARVREVDFGDTSIRTIDFAEPAGYLLWNRDHGRVLISPDGRELLCEPDPTNAEWAAIVVAQALPLAATLRGLEVLHASGVVLDGRAVLITGAAGAGKSSLAAALLRAGGLLLSDDAVALRLCDGTLLAYPGSLALQLRAAEDRRLAAPERAALGRPAGEVEGKRRYVSADPPPPAPLGGLFLLERSAAQPAVQPLADVSPFALLASTFNLSVRTPERLQRQLDVAAAIAAGGLVHRLRVQPGVDATKLAALVRAYLSAHAPADSRLCAVAAPGEGRPRDAGARRARAMEL
ncbi:MAG TPA: hypothetical protein VNV42_03240 [Solirubrobacteraceae bacterium]|jgi:hypothetical protein|nr:hypothetical protein [Solirubrobacteraceae bacterium]